MPRWFKISLVGALVLVLLLALSAGALLAVLRTDDQRLGQALELLLGYLLQRELVIGEVVEAELEWDAYLLARDVHLSNPEWAGELEFASARELMIRINLPSLWQQGPILIHEVSLEGAHLNLLADEGQPPSWDFWPEREKQDSESTGESVEFPVVVSAGRISDSAILYRDPDQHVRILLDGQLGERQGSDRIQLDLSGSVNDIPLAGYGEIGPKAALLSGADVTLDLDVQWGGLDIRGRGRLAELSSLSGPDISLAVRSPSSRALLDMLGMPEVRDGPLELLATVTDAAPGWAIDARGRLEEFDLRLSGVAAQPLQLDGLDLEFAIDGPSLTELGAMFNLPDLPQVTYEVSGEIKRQGRLFAIRRGRMTAGDARLRLDGQLPNFPAIDDWQASLRGEHFNLALIAPLIGLEQLPVVPYNVHGDLASNDDGVELVDFRVTGENTSLLLNGVIGDAPDYLGTQLELELEGPDMSRIGHTLGIDAMPPEPFTLVGEVSLDKNGWLVKDSRFNSPSLQLTLNGKADRLVTPESVTGNFDLSSPDLAATAAAYGLELPVLEDFPLQAAIQVQGVPTDLTITGAQLRSGDHTAQLSGKLGDILQPTALNLAVALQGPDLLGLFQAEQQDLSTELPYQLQGRVIAEPAGYRLDGFKGRLGGSDLVLAGLLTNNDDLRGSQLQLRASGPALGASFGPWVDYSLPALPFALELDAEYQPPLLNVPRLEANVGEHRLSGSLDLQEVDGETSGQGRLHFSGDSSLQLLAMFGWEPDLLDRNYSLETPLRAVGKQLHLDAIELKVGRSDLTGRLSMDMRKEGVPAIAANLHSKLVYLPFLVPDLEQMEKEEAAREARGEAEEDDLTDELTRAELAERVIPTTAIDVSWLDDLSLDLEYRIAEIYLSDAGRSSGRLSLVIDDGRLQTRDLSWQGAYSEGEAEITLARQGDAAAIDLYLNSSRLPMLWLLTGEPQTNRESVYRIQVTGQGRSVDELVASLDGVLAFKGGGGRMDNRGLDLVLGDIFGEVVTRVNPYAESDTHTNIECHAGAVSFGDGKLKAVPGLVVRTDKLDIVSSGSINLENERLDMVFNTRSRRGIGISASKAITPYIKLGGNLANPQLGLNVKGAAVSGGAAIATGGLSILAEGMWDRWVATSRNPCDLLVERVTKDPGREYRALFGRP